MENNKPVVLIFCDYYLPGYKSGGGMRTIVNTVDLLKYKFDFRIVTRDYDGKLDRKSYKTVKINEWNDVNGSKVFYLAKRNYKLPTIYKLITELKPAKIYTNSFFSSLAICVFILRAVRLISRTNLIVAPCGELSPNALKIKSLKKRIFIAFVKLFRLNSNIIWRASTELEVPQIKTVKGNTGITLVAPDLLPETILVGYEADSRIKKFPGELKLVFISRFVRIKNFKWLLKFLHKINGKLSIDIFAPLEDEQYWRECCEIINELPEKITVTYNGAVRHEQVGKTFLNYHFFILPTLSENFGHICLEALGAGCPLIISNKTPWLNLKMEEIGWDLPLENQQLWIDKLNHCLNMDNAEYQHLSKSARRFAEKLVFDKKLIEATENVLSYTE